MTQNESRVIANGLNNHTYKAWTEQYLQIKLAEDD
jgi:hypothetical protein